MGCAHMTPSAFEIVRKGSTSTCAAQFIISRRIETSIVGWTLTKPNHAMRYEEQMVSPVNHRVPVATKRNQMASRAVCRCGHDTHK